MNIWIRHYKKFIAIPFYLVLTISNISSAKEFNADAIVTGVGSIIEKAKIGCDEVKGDFGSCEDGAAVGFLLSTEKLRRVRNLTTTYPKESQKKLEKAFVSQGLSKKSASKKSRQLIKFAKSKTALRSIRGAWFFGLAGTIYELSDINDSKPIINNEKRILIKRPRIDK